MKQRPFVKVVLMAAVLMLLLPTVAFSRAKIPVGERDVINVVYKTPTQDSIEIDGKHLDIGCYHREYNIGYILPLYVIKEPVLVYYDKTSKVYYEPRTPEEKAILQSYIKKKKLNEADLLNLGFYTRYGGKLVGLVLLAIILFGAWGEIKKVFSRLKEQ